ncbi:hypothetical protein [Streptomyces neyagawaensis]|uniref:Uncharacterized protein n=1 Tax=Streptomyces neyagawaensis TaxID=42238 RepID=A0ABV3B2I6_9ACTN
MDVTTRSVGEVMTREVVEARRALAAHPHGKLVTEPVGPFEAEERVRLTAALTPWRERRDGGRTAGPSREQDTSARRCS